MVTKTIAGLGCFSNGDVIYNFTNVLLQKCGF